MRHSTAGHPRQCSVPRCSGRPSCPVLRPVLRPARVLRLGCDVAEVGPWPGLALVAAAGNVVHCWSENGPGVLPRSARTLKQTFVPGVSEPIVLALSVPGTGSAFVWAPPSSS